MITKAIRSRRISKEGWQSAIPRRLRQSSILSQGFNSYTKKMFETRLANETDAELIAGQRRAMFLAMGRPDDEAMHAMITNFVPWVRQKLREGRYLGWLVEENGLVLAGAGMWLMEFPPHLRDPQPLRAYLLNFYVAPQARNRGIASKLVKTAIHEAETRGIRVVSLHASEFGRPLYERSGFEPTNEMMLNL